MTVSFWTAILGLNGSKPCGSSIVMITCCDEMCVDHNLRFERAMHGTPRRDLEQPRALFLAQRAAELDVAVYVIEDADSGIRLFAVGRVNFRV